MTPGDLQDTRNVTCTARKRHRGRHVVTGLTLFETENMTLTCLGGSVPEDERRTFGLTEPCAL